MLTMLVRFGLLKYLLALAADAQVFMSVKYTGAIAADACLRA